MCSEHNAIRSKRVRTRCADVILALSLMISVVDLDIILVLFIRHPVSLLIFDLV